MRGEGFDADPFIGPAPCWYVIFSGDEKRQHIVDYLSPLEFLHCAAFFYDARGERWCVYDVNRGGVAINALSSDQFDRWIWYMKRYRRARILKVDWRARTRPPVQLGMWCVVAVRYAIGSRSLALRPIGLWRDLLREGAVEVFV